MTEPIIPGKPHPSTKLLRSHPQNAAPTRSYTTPEGTWEMTPAGNFKLKDQ